MADMPLRVAIVGSGIGGVALSIALARIGCEVTVFEQASRFGRVGAGINLTPNAVRILDFLGAGERLRRSAAAPSARVSKQWDTGSETSRLPLGDSAERVYGAAQLTIHRADLLEALEALIPPGTVRFGKRLIDLEEHGAVHLRFADGSEATADAVVGCDGIHSTVRGALFGEAEPVFAGMSAFRSIVPASRVRPYETDAFVKWWGPDPKSQIVTMPINRGEDLFIFATVPEDGWRHESWSMSGDVAEIRERYADYCEEARRPIGAIETTQKTALYDREPLERWSAGRVTLLGDAAHPMMPFMAQGAAMGLEDAAVLMRVLDGIRDPAGVPCALRRYEEVRRPRASSIQRASAANEWLRTGVDAGWVYRYDALATALEPA